MPRRRESPWAAHAALAAVVLLWASAFPAVKALLEDGIPAGDIALLRYLVAAPGFALAFRLTGGLPGLRRPDTFRLAAAGLLVVVGYHVSLNLGTRSTTAGTAALVVALTPGVTLALAASVGLERLVLRRVLGLAVAFGGVVVVVLLRTGGAVSLERAEGPATVLGAALSFALYNIVLAPLVGRHGILALTAATSLVGTLGSSRLPGRRASGRSLPPRRATALILYLGLACTLCGYVGWNLGLRGLGASRAVAYTYAISPLAVVLGAIGLGEPVTMWLALGGVLVVSGVVVAQHAADGRGQGDAGLVPTSRTRPPGSPGSPSP